MPTTNLKPSLCNTFALQLISFICNVIKYLFHLTHFDHSCSDLTHGVKWGIVLVVWTIIKPPTITNCLVSYFT